MPELNIPDDYLNRPRLQLGQGPLSLGPQFQFEPPEFQLPAEPVAPLAPASLEQRVGAMSGVEKFFAALQGLAAGLQGKPDPTMALHERQFERDQQRYLTEKQDYEAARRQFQQLKAQADLQAERVKAEKDLQKERITAEKEIETSKQKFATERQAADIASREFTAGIQVLGDQLKSDNVATVQAGLSAIENNAAARRFFGNLDRQAILTQAKALQDAGTDLKKAQTRHFQMSADLEKFKYEVATGARPVPERVVLQAMGMSVDSLADTMAFREVEALKKRNPALASAILLSKGNALGALTSFALIDAYDAAAKTGKTVDAQEVISGLFDKLKESDEATQRALDRTSAEAAKAIERAMGNPQLQEQILSFFLPQLKHYYQKLGIKTDTSKLGLTSQQQFGAILEEEARKAAEAKRGRGAPLMPGLGGK